MRNLVGLNPPTSRVCISTMHTLIRLDAPAANRIRRRMFPVVGRFRAATGVMMVVGKVRSAHRAIAKIVPAMVVIRSVPSEVSARRAAYVASRAAAATRISRVARFACSTCRERKPSFQPFRRRRHHAVHQFLFRFAEQCRSRNAGKAALCSRHRDILLLLVIIVRLHSETAVRPPRRMWRRSPLPASPTLRRMAAA